MTGHTQQLINDFVITTYIDHLGVIHTSSSHQGIIYMIDGIIQFIHGDSQ
jgi:GTPase involved in cell partitioning and DNA repair